jgi:hypothetical protein
MAIGYILWSFGTFLPFWYVVAGKIWQPCLAAVFVEESLVLRVDLFRAAAGIQPRRENRPVLGPML